MSHLSHVNQDVNNIIDILPDSEENPSDGKSNSGNEKHESVMEDNVQFM